MRFSAGALTCQGYWGLPTAGVNYSMFLSDRCECQVAAQGSGHASQYTGALSKHGVAAPVPTEHTNGAEYGSLATISTETSWVGPTVPSSSVCTGYNVLPYEVPMFLT